ncbi:MAG: DUF6020 family protein [bacterium]|nr:DUF6020 family protein [bacterium]
MKGEGLLSKKIAYPLFAAIGVLFLFFSLTERKLAEEGNIVWTSSYTLRTLAISLIAGLLLGAAVCRGLYRMAGKAADTQRAKKDGQEEERKEQRSWADAARQWHDIPPGKAYTVSLILILAAWVPCYLAYYPGICAYDMPVQTGQLLTAEFNEHHPIAHTLLIGLAMKLGDRLFQSVNTGIGLLTFLQMLFLAAVFAYAIVLLKKRGLGIGFMVVAQIYCMLYPFHFYMGVSLTKDTIFTGFFMLQLMSLAELSAGEDNGRGIPILFFLSSVGMVLFRNNGKYALLALLFVFFLTVIFCRKGRRRTGKLFVLGMCAFLTGIFALKLLSAATEAVQGDKREMLSMPIQQLARVMIYHGGVGVQPEDDNTLEDAQKALINEFILNEAYREYDAHISDPVKRHTNTYVVRYRTVDFMRVYLQLLKKYPGDFVNAVLELNAGYLSPWDVSHAHVNEVEGVKGKGYVQTRWDEQTLQERGIYKDSLWSGLHERLEKWADENAYLKLPILKYLFVPGVWLWLYLLLFGFLLLRREFAACLPLALVAGYYVTLFLGPTVQLRYIYPVMAAFPFLALLLLKREREEA